MNCCSMIPIKCFGCGTVVASRYRTYRENVRSFKLSKNMVVDKIVYLSAENTEKTIEGKEMDKLDILNPCCRTLFLTHTDI